MSLPVAYQPSVVSDDDNVERMKLLAIEVSGDAKTPALANIDEYWHFCEGSTAAMRELRRHDGLSIAPSPVIVRD